MYISNREKRYYQGIEVYDAENLPRVLATHPISNGFFEKQVGVLKNIHHGLLITISGIGRVCFLGTHGDRDTYSGASSAYQRRLYRGEFTIDGNRGFVDPGYITIATNQKKPIVTSSRNSGQLIKECAIEIIHAISDNKEAFDAIRYSSYRSGYVFIVSSCANGFRCFIEIAATKWDSMNRAERYKYFNSNCALEEKRKLQKRIRGTLL